MHQQRCLFCRHRNLFVAGTPHFDPPIHGCGRSRCWAACTFLTPPASRRGGFDIMVGSLTPMDVPTCVVCVQG